ncbi:hypothetical protein A3Q56_05967 [Intoshia linei]|uniref:pantothenate kinase n=1 Tax=Intoshia linei TaxID=1819745 RepID=A0A177AWE8_9BILA|nr:hypothetical protein A3Q56_05967 [Intoshia linei]
MHNLPLVGLDIGGTLVKLAYLDIYNLDSSDPKLVKLSNDIHHFVKNPRTYGKTGVFDNYLTIENVELNGYKGSLKFIRFPSSDMPLFIKICGQRHFSTFLETIHVTGGGAFKYNNEMEQIASCSLSKHDEFKSLISGLEYIKIVNPLNEMYYLNKSYESCNWSMEDLYPYLIINIGTGVSVIHVISRNQFERVTGTSIGGGTFTSLCNLLTGSKGFDQAMQLAETGESQNVDLLVSDIYGGNYDLFNLPGDVVASSFAKLKDKSHASKNDIANGLLTMIANNIGSIALMCAFTKQCNNILFCGNFLRENNIAKEKLSYAMDYWSKGEKRAYFAQHNGYFGAIGSMVLSLTQ